MHRCPHGQPRATCARSTEHLVRQQSHVLGKSTCVSGCARAAEASPRQHPGLVPGPRAVSRGASRAHHADTGPFRRRTQQDEKQPDQALLSKARTPSSEFRPPNLPTLPWRDGSGAESETVTRRLGLTNMSRLFPGVGIRLFFAAMSLETRIQIRVCVVVL